MEKIYIVYEEREESRFCGIKGVWRNREQAIVFMKQLIRNNELYSKISDIDFFKGYAQSDPMYNEDIYSDYYVWELEVK